MSAIAEATAASAPGTLRLEEQEGQWLASCWRKGAPRREGTTIAYGETVEDASRALLRKLKRKAKA